jgi:hypothetical protein
MQVVGSRIVGEDPWALLARVVGVPDGVADVAGGLGDRPRSAGAREPRFQAVASIVAERPVQRGDRSGITSRTDDLVVEVEGGCLEIVLGWR